VPLIAIGVAVVADVVAGAAVAATVGGIAAISTVTALEVVAAVGATVAAVGAVTKNKALSLAGGVIGAIGAIGGLAAGAGLLGEAAASNAPLFGAPAAAGTEDAAAAGTVDAVARGAGDTSLGVPDASLPLPPPAPPGGVGSVDPATGNVITVPQPSAALANPPPDDVTLFSAGAGEVPRTGQPGATQTAQADASAAPTPNAQTAQNTAVPPPPNATPGQAGVSTPAPASLGTQPRTGNTGVAPDTGFLSSFKGLADFADAHPAVAFGAVQGAASLLSGLTSTLTPAQVSLAQAQAAANDAAAALTKQQTANLAAPKAVASSAPVTGAPQQLVPTAPPPQATPAGFINQNPVPTQPVTGVAA
jgi:hypothetical protein